MEAGFERCFASAACEKSIGNRYSKSTGNIGITNVDRVLHGKIFLESSDSLQFLLAKHMSSYGKLQYSVCKCFCELRIVDRLRKLKIGSSEPRHPKKKRLPPGSMIGGKKATKNHQKVEIGKLCFVQVFLLGEVRWKDA